MEIPASGHIWTSIAGQHLMYCILGTLDTPISTQNIGLRVKKLLKGVVIEIKSNWKNGCKVENAKCLKNNNSFIGPKTHIFLHQE